MGLFDSLFGPSKNVVTTRPQVIEGYEPLVSEAAKQALRYAQAPYRMRPFQRIAGLTPDQLAGMQAIRGIATDPALGQQYGEASDILRQSIGDPTAQGMISSLGRTITPERISAERWSPEVMKTYMSPYQEAVIDRYMRREDERTGERRADLMRRQAGKKAFGSGADITRAQFERDEETRKADALAKMLESGYQTAAGQFATEAARAQEAARANQAAGLTAEQLRTSGLGAGVQAELGRLGGQRGAAASLADLASRYQQAQYGGAEKLMGVGAMQQAQQQKGLSLQEQDWLEQQRYPREMGSYLAGIVSGAPRGSEQTSPGPGFLQQALGTGLGLAGIYKGFGFRHGGAAHMEEGGSVEDAVKPSFDERMKRILQMMQTRKLRENAGGAEQERIRRLDQRLYEAYAPPSRRTPERASFARGGIARMQYGGDPESYESERLAELAGAAREPEDRTTPLVEYLRRIKSGMFDPSGAPKRLFGRPDPALKEAIDREIMAGAKSPSEIIAGLLPEKDFLTRALTPKTTYIAEAPTPPSAPAPDLEGLRGPAFGAAKLPPEAGRSFVRGSGIESEELPADATGLPEDMKPSGLGFDYKPAPMAPEAPPSAAMTGKDRYAQIMDKLIGQYNPERDKWLALAQAGAAMAASRRPGLLPALAEGAQAGLGALRASEAEQRKVLQEAAQIQGKSEARQQAERELQITRDRLNELIRSNASNEEIARARLLYENARVKAEERRVTRLEEAAVYLSPRDALKDIEDAGLKAEKAMRDSLSIAKPILGPEDEAKIQQVGAAARARAAQNAQYAMRPEHMRFVKSYIGMTPDELKSKARSAIKEFGKAPETVAKMKDEFKKAGYSPSLIDEVLVE
jgi:hypothetical protein